jgi:hypothetical protein
MEKRKVLKEEEQQQQKQQEEQGGISMPPGLNESFRAQGEQRLGPGSFAPDRRLPVSEVPKD